MMRSLSFPPTVSGRLKLKDNGLSKEDEKGRPTFSASNARKIKLKKYHEKENHNHCRRGLSDNPFIKSKGLGRVRSKRRGRNFYNGKKRQR